MTRTTTLDNIMTTKDLVLGMRYTFPYSRIQWTYIGDSNFYSPEYDIYKVVTNTFFHAVPC
jgi:hypothetical protein